MAKFWDTEEVILEVGNIKVKKVTKGTTKYIDIRKYFQDATDNWCPTSKGIAIPDDFVDEIADVMIKSGGRQDD
jgi:hypothetical protein